MIAILYESTETNFSSNGLGRLLDASNCLVTEERNGIYELEFDYPVTGAKFDLLKCGMIVAVSHDQSGDVQPFDLVGYSKPINGVVTFRGVHISYRLNNMVIPNGTGKQSLAQSLELCETNGSPFTFSADFIATGYMSACEKGVPIPVRSVMGGVDGSILDAYGGEWEFDRFACTLRQNRGKDLPMVVRYGHNMIDYVDESDFSETYNACYAYWGSGDNPFTVYVESGLPSFDGRTRVGVLDLTDKFETTPTATQLENAAKSYMRKNQTNMPQQNISIQFADYKDYGKSSALRHLETCRLCDTIGVEFPMYGMSGRMRVVKTVWDPLQERYSEIELGSLKTSLAGALFGGNNV